jgi:hypothetical protein
MRLSRLGLYAAVIGQMLGEPVDLSGSDVEVQAALRALKEAHRPQYELAKRVVLGSGYGLTPHGMVEQFPESFPTLALAQQVQAYYYQLAPEVPAWQLRVQQRAKTMGYLGGRPAPSHPPTEWDHPYGYQHWFWDVLSYRPIDDYTARQWQRTEQGRARIVSLHGRPFQVVPGGDAKRVIAYYPQSTISGRLKEAELDLFLPDSPTYIGDCYFGRTPLLAPIHDALLLHIPTRCFDRVAEIVCQVMGRPSPALPCDPAWQMGSHLAIGVEAKTGRHWGAMEALTMGEREGSSIVLRPPEESREEWDALARALARPTPGDDLTGGSTTRSPSPTR